jgi:hypothetical protein
MDKNMLKIRVSGGKKGYSNKGKGYLKMKNQEPIISPRLKMLCIPMQLA